MLNLLVRLILPLITAALSALGLILIWRNPWWGVLLVVMLALTGIGIYDWIQPHRSITRNYPLAGRIRWLFLSLRPYLRAYIVEDNLNGTPYSYAARQLIHARARAGHDTQPFGTERDTSAPEYHWISHSIAPAEEPDQEPSVTVGNAQTGQPYQTSILNISAMSFGSLSGRAIAALNQGARLAGCYQDTGEGGISRYHRQHGGDLVWELGTGYFGARDRHGRFDAGLFREQARHEQVKMTEIKLSQGAKPGHGGMLPARKVSEEIAEARQVPAHEDCLSPHAHTSFSTPIELLEFAARLRELSGGKPVGIKLCVGQPHEVFAIIKAILKTGIHPEFIVVDGAEGGTGAAPRELSDWVGMPLEDGLVLMRNALVGAGLRDQIKLVASGKIYSGMGLAHNLAIGADWCNAARAFMMSIGCIQSRRCHLGSCPGGVATQDPRRQRGLVVDVQAQRAAQFHRKTVAALAEITAAAGVVHPRLLQPHHLFRRTGVARVLEQDRIYPFLPQGALLDAPEETCYAEWWAAATAERFGPNTDLVAKRASAKRSVTAN